MSYQATVFNVMIASPSDVSVERTIIRDVLNEWNIINSFTRGIVLLPIGWESNSSPEMGDTPQNIINKQVLEKSDILIGVFWTRLGTPTDEYASGSVEEIEKHIQSGKLTMLYFSNQPVMLDSIDINQYNELNQFKESCKGRSLYETYSDLENFKNSFKNHLQLKINEHEVFINTKAESALGNNISSSAPKLSDEAKKLLKEASKDPSGVIICIRDFSGTMIATNGRMFGESQTPREIAKWKAAIDNLENEKLVINANLMGETYSLTELGYRIADAIEENLA